MLVSSSRRPLIGLSPTQTSFRGLNPSKIICNGIFRIQKYLLWAYACRKVVATAWSPSLDGLESIKKVLTYSYLQQDNLSASECLIVILCPCKLSCFLRIANVFWRSAHTNGNLVALSQSKILWWFIPIRNILWWADLHPDYLLAKIFATSLTPSKKFCDALCPSGKILELIYSVVV
jgi:hypothetical protein